MTNLPVALRPVAFLLCIAGLASGTAAAPAGPIGSLSTSVVVAPAPTAVQRAAIGDPPRRRARRAAGKDKPYVPLAKDPQAESEAAHKEYLKRYGF